MKESQTDLKIQNPKFKFSESQTRDIMMAAYHLSKAAEHLMDTNGMLGLIYNSQSIELLDQAGLSQIFLDELGYTKTVEPQIKLSEAEAKEVDDIFNELMGSDAEKEGKCEWNGTLGDEKLDNMFRELMDIEPANKTTQCGQTFVKPTDSGDSKDAKPASRTSDNSESCCGDLKSETKSRDKDLKHEVKKTETPLKVENTESCCGDLKTETKSRDKDLKTESTETCCKDIKSEVEKTETPLKVENTEKPSNKLNHESSKSEHDSNESKDESTKVTGKTPLKVDKSKTPTSKSKSSPSNKSKSKKVKK